MSTLRTLALFSLIAISASSIAPTTSFAQQRRCPAGESGCNLSNFGDKVQERSRQGVKDVNDASGPVDKAKAAGKTVKDCLQCATDAVKKGFNQ